MLSKLSRTSATRCWHAAWQLRAGQAGLRASAGLQEEDVHLYTGTGSANPNAVVQNREAQQKIAEVSAARVPKPRVRDPGDIATNGEVRNMAAVKRGAKGAPKHANAPMSGATDSGATQQRAREYSSLAPRSMGSLGWRGAASAAGGGKFHDDTAGSAPNDPGLDPGASGAQNFPEAGAHFPEGAQQDLKRDLRAEEALTGARPQAPPEGAAEIATDNPIKDTRAANRGRPGDPTSRGYTSWAGLGARRWYSAGGAEAAGGGNNPLTPDEFQSEPYPTDTGDDHPDKNIGSARGGGAASAEGGPDLHPATSELGTDGSIGAEHSGAPLDDAKEAPSESHAAAAMDRHPGGQTTGKTPFGGARPFSTSTRRGAPAALRSAPFSAAAAAAAGCKDYGTTGAPTHEDLYRDRNPPSPPLPSESASAACL